MSNIKSRKHQRTSQLLMLAASLPLVAHAAPEKPEEPQHSRAEKHAEHDHRDARDRRDGHDHRDGRANDLPTIKIKADKETYKVSQVSSAKYTQPIVDTPQTISVINKEIIKDQGATSLTEALQNTPGITLQLGENGNTSAGDTFQMRGFSTQTSTFVDGIRDLGAISRDVFNLEQIEVVKGASGSESGRGSASGYINLVSKLPKASDSTETSLQWNTANRRRLSADINRVVNEDISVRLNIVGQEGGVIGRDYIENNKVGIAPSILINLNKDTRFYIYSQHIRQSNIPDGGVPVVGMNGYYYVYSGSYTNNNISADLRNKILADINNSADAQKITSALRNAPAADHKNFYGNEDDHEDVNADMITTKIESDLASNVKLSNITRLGKTHMERALTGVGGVNNTPTTTVTVNANNTYNIKFNYGTFDPANPDSFTVSRSYQGVDQENRILGNTTTLNIDLTTAGIEHALVTGLEILREEQLTRTLSTQVPGSAAPTTPSANLYNPDRNQLFPRLAHNGAFTDGSTDTIAAYVFDTIKINEQFQLSGGVRLDHYTTTYDALSVTTTGTSPNFVVTKTPTHIKAKDDLVSWKLGGLFKPTTYSSVYASYAKSLTPPGSANFSLSTTANTANNPVAKPQETNNYEVGTKWNVLNDQLALAAAVYRTDNENQFTTDPVTLAAIQEGKTRVEGIELSGVGQITKFWDFSAGVAHMKTKQINQQSVSAGVVTITDSVRWSPEWTATLWSTYQLGDLRFGAGARYVGDQKRAITNSTALVSFPKIPSYMVFDALASYEINKQASVNLNIYNLADKDYISSLNNGGNRIIIGQPRSAALTLNYKF